MTRREWAIWSVVLVVACLLVWWTETRNYTQCRAQYRAAQCDAWLVR